MKKNAIALLLLLLAATAVLAACGSKDDKQPASNPPDSTSNTATASSGSDDGKPKADDAPFTVTLMHSNVTDARKPDLARLERVVDKAQADVPGLTVKLEGYKDTVLRFEKLPALMTAGTQPQIFELFGGSDTMKYANAGKLLDLTPIVEELGIKDKFINLSEFTVDGKIYGLPMAGYAEGFFYNKAILKDLGYDAFPTKWDDLLALADKAKAAGYQPPFALAANAPWVINMMTNTLWVREAGPDIIEQLVAGTKKWTDPALVEAFAKYQTLVQKGYLDGKGSLGLDYNAQQDLFSSRKSAAVFDGSWANANIINPDKSKVRDEVGFAQFPDTGGPGDGYINASYSDGYGFSANANDRELAAIKAFIREMYSDETQGNQLTEQGYMPSMDIALPDSVHPIVGEIIAAAKSAKGTFPAFDSIIQASVREAIETQMQALLAGQTTPDKMTEAIQKAQDEANASADKK